MNVLVAGGAGYVGSVLTTHLQRAGHEAEAVDRLLYGWVDHESPLIVSDVRRLTDGDLLGFDAVVNLAGLSNDPTAEFNPKANDRLNTDMAVTLMKHAGPAGVTRTVLAAPASGTATSPEQDMADEHAVLVPPEDMYPYSKSKIYAERKLAEVADEYDMSLVVLRKGTVHGWSPRMRFDLVVNAMVGTALNRGFVECHASPRGAMYRPIVDVADVALAYEKAIELELPDRRCETFNIVTDNLSILEIAGHVVAGVARQVGRTPELRIQEIPADRNIRSYKMSADRATAILGWRPNLRLADSVDRLVTRVALKPEEFFDERTRNIDWMKRYLQLEEGFYEDGRLLS